MHNKSYLAIYASLLLATASCNAASQELRASQYGDFDSYVLALSWQPGFCQSMHERGRSEPQECQSRQINKDTHQGLTIHGLWPSLPASIASHGVDNKRWMRFGCAARPLPNMPEVKAGKKCAAPETGLSSNLAQQLQQAMPGAGAPSCLERYEYAKHGICFGFDANAYFGTMLQLSGEINRSSFGAFMKQNYGKTVTRDNFNKAFSAAFGAGSERAVKLTCHGNPSYLTELQVTLKASEINHPLRSDSFISQPHRGNCGDNFLLDAAGY